jgi:hypothetical protein
VLSIPETDPHPQETLHHRSTSYVSVKLALADQLSLRNVFYVQPRFDEPSDVRVLDELALDLNVNDYLAVVNSFALRFDSEPPSTIEKLDVSLTLGLRLTSDPAR